MKIEISGAFQRKFFNQLDYIAADKPGAARQFRKDVLHEIKKIARQPFAARKSVFFEDDNIRELVFKGYLIIFRLNIKENTILVFGFLKYTESP